MSLNEEQQKAYDLMCSNKSIFLTGPGGVGKSHTLQKYYEHAVKLYTGKCVFKTSSTGVSALLIGGKTLHAHCGIFLGHGTVDELIAGISYPIKQRWIKTKVLFIDEISMIHPILFDKIEHIARKVRRSNLPFGGIQVICSGDFFQLSPVCEDNKERYCFEAESWDKVILHTVELKTIVRQKDLVFQKLLNEVRYGHISKENSEILESKLDVELINDYGIEPTMFFSKNVDVNYVNTQKLEELLEKETRYEYNAKYIFEYNISNMTKDKIIEKVEMLSKNLILSKTVLAVGAQVVFKKNINDMVANGTRGVVVSFKRVPLSNEDSELYPLVRLLNGCDHLAVPESFEFESKDEYKLSKLHVPLKLAWSMSLHSSQGSTIDYAKMDLGSSIFACGQAYVGLSRMKNLDGLSLIAYDPKSIKASPKVLAKYGKN